MRTPTLIRLLGPALLLAPALLASAPAYAWKHTGRVWCDGDDFPIPYLVEPNGEESVPEGYSHIAIQAGFDQWTDFAPCAGVGGEFVGDAPANTGFRLDGTNRFTFNDPADELGAGVLAANVTQPQSGAQICFEQDGTIYTKITDSDIVWNDNVAFTTEDDIAAGTCNGSHSMVSVATHEIGHGFGLGHSCDNGDPCTEQDLREATMYWTGPACDSSGVTINADDIEGINSLYGPYASIECSSELDPEDPDTIAFGIVDFTIRCRVISKSRDEVTEAVWQWGDGATSTGLDAEHTYTTAGNYTLQVNIDGNNQTCGDWNYTARRVGYVRACAVPQPEFTYRHIDGLTYDLLNDTDLSVYGCVFDIQWDIFQGDRLVDSLKAWEPRYTFPEEGDYRIVLNVGGPAGTGAAEIRVEAKNQRGEGYGACDMGASPTGGAGVLLAAGLLWRRRKAGRKA